MSNSNQKGSLELLAFNWPVKRYEKQSDTDFEGNSSNLCRTHLTLSQVSITICNVMDGTLCHLCTTFQSNLSKNHKQSIYMLQICHKRGKFTRHIGQVEFKMFTSICEILLNLTKVEPLFSLSHRRSDYSPYWLC